MHLHGGYVPAAHDGHPMDVIAAGGTFDYHYPNDQDAATLWYHDHAHGRTSRTLYYGLLAMYVLEDDLGTQLGLPQGSYDVPIVIADHAFNKDGSFRYEENVDLGFRGDTILVNGAVSPRMTVERRKYRLRFLNGSNARSYAQTGPGAPDARDRRRRWPALEAGLAHEDPDPSRRAHRPRARLSAYGPGEQLVLSNADGLGGTVPIMRFDVRAARTSEDFTVPSRLRSPTGCRRQRPPHLEPRARDGRLADQRARL